jgi:hypothetical protein
MAELGLMDEDVGLDILLGVWTAKSDCANWSSLDRSGD